MIILNYSFIPALKNDLSLLYSDFLSLVHGINPPVPEELGAGIFPELDWNRYQELEGLDYQCFSWVLEKCFPDIVTLEYDGSRKNFACGSNSHSIIRQVESIRGIKKSNRCLRKKGIIKLM